MEHKELKKELDADLRNKLTFPRILLETARQNKKVNKKDIQRAIRNLRQASCLVEKWFRPPRVVITGRGVVAPNGIGQQAFSDALSQGRSGIGQIQAFDSSKYPTRYAGEVKGFKADEYLDPKKARRLDRFAQFGLVSAKMAIEDAGLDLNRIDKSRVGVLMGSAVGGQGWAFDQFLILQAHGYKKLNPFTTASTFPNALSTSISLEFGFTGISETISTGCASSSIAMGHAFDLIRSGSLDVAVAGGAEALIQEPIFASFCRSRVLSELNAFDENHILSPRPFDLKRDGTLLGEGAGVLILESYDHALARNAPIYGEVLSWFSNCDAFHPIAHDASGFVLARCITEAVKQAGLQLSDIDYIKAHGVGDKDLDLAETRAYKLAFGGIAQKIPLSSVKSMIGHTQGASGAIEMVALVLSLDSSTIYPTINYQEPDPECDLNYTPNRSVRLDHYNHALHVITGFGGKNACIVIGRHNV